MKKILLILAFLIVLTAAKSQTRYVLYVDSAFNNHVSDTPLPLVAIWGNFANLLSKPTTIAGYGITDALSSTSPLNIAAKTANYTVVSGDFASGKLSQIFISFDCTAGNLTVTLPSASSFTGYKVFVTKTDATSNALTISGLGSDSVIGTKGWVKECISNGSTWVNN